MGQARFRSQHFSANDLGARQACAAVVQELEDGRGHGPQRLTGFAPAIRLVARRPRLHQAAEFMVRFVGLNELPAGRGLIKGQKNKRTNRRNLNHEMDADRRDAPGSVGRRF